MVAGEIQTLGPLSPPPPPTHTHVQRLSYQNIGLYRHMTVQKADCTNKNVTGTSTKL